MRSPGVGANPVLQVSFISSLFSGRAWIGSNGCIVIPTIAVPALHSPTGVRASSCCRFSAPGYASLITLTA